MASSLWQLLSKYNVTIPIIQRDYAQGRQIGKAPVIRKRFLNAIFESLSNQESTLELDFIYGYTIKNKEGKKTTFVPLDGQQRLTTLFLLHWYSALVEGKSVSDRELLIKFSYETRHSSRVFCENLVKFTPSDLQKVISETIINQPWFFATWKNDPTIAAMLVMLDSIQEMFKSHPLQNIWPLLTSDEPKIIFHMLPMDELGLPDDLYIKMNSRGKELTDFEYFKSRFSEVLNPTQGKYFNENIDQNWSDLFWNLFKNENHKDLAQYADDAFLRFFHFITDIIIAKESISITSEEDEFESYKLVYNCQSNVDFLFNSLNLFWELQSSNSDFFSKTFYLESDDFDPSKTRLFFQNASVNLFDKCSRSFDSQSRINPFSIGEQLILFACIIHKTHNSTDFNSRIRIIRNLITNSGDTVRKENLNSLLNSVSEIILNGTIDKDTKFNSTQVEEEEIKKKLIELDLILIHNLYKLEDHHLLQGCIRAFIKQDKFIDITVPFYELFLPECDYILIDKALFTFGDYTQDIKWRTIMGRNEQAWRELLTPSTAKKGFEKTSETLQLYFNFKIENPNANLNEIIRDYLLEFDNESSKPKDWKYYFVKYSNFWNNEDGYYYWHSDTLLYESIMMRRSTTNGFNWSPFLYILHKHFPDVCNLDNYGAPLVFVKGNATLKITNINRGFKILAESQDDHELLDKLKKKTPIDNDGIFIINQTSDGIDVEDRIEKGLTLINNLITL